LLVTSITLTEKTAGARHTRLTNHIVVTEVKELRMQHVAMVQGNRRAVLFVHLRSATGATIGGWRRWERIRRWQEWLLLLLL
jgi:hypothetical protein